MNKFLSIFALVALIACSASAGSTTETPKGNNLLVDLISPPSFPDNEGEIKDMPDNLKPIFTEYCLEARDKVQNYVKAFRQEVSVKVINIVMNTITNIANEALIRQMRYSDNRANRLSEPISPVPIKNVDQESGGELESGEESKDELENVDEAQKPGWVRFVRAISRAFGQFSRSFYSETILYLYRLKDDMDVENFVENVDEICDNMQVGLFRDIENMFTTKNSAMRRLASRNRDGQTEALLKKTKIEHLKCATIDRMHFFKSICGAWKKTVNILQTISSMSSGSG